MHLKTLETTRTILETAVKVGKLSQLEGALLFAKQAGVLEQFGALALECLSEKTPFKALTR